MFDPVSKHSCAGIYLLQAATNGTQPLLTPLCKNSGRHVACGCLTVTVVTMRSIVKVGTALALIMMNTTGSALAYTAPAGTLAPTGSLSSAPRHTQARSGPRRGR